MKKKVILYVALAAMILTLAGIVFYYWYKNNNYVDTEDARVDGAIVKVSPQITGRIAEVSVVEGDPVKEGEIVARQVDFSLKQGDNLDLSVIRSPITGTVIKKVGNTGEIGVPGQPVVMVTDLGSLYITANIEEKKLYKIKEGQDVDFTIDSIPAVKFKGQVASIGEATVSMFTLLPAQSSGGSFTKVAQRIPVKITIKGYQGQRLLPGMNAVVRIHIR